MANRKGRPFLEIFALALKEDFRFPTFELFAFLFCVGTFVFANFGSTMFYSTSVTSNTAYNVTSSALSTVLFIFMILVFKNIAYGLGSDLEKGIVQTYLSYPLKRRSILSAKLLSALGVSLMLFLGVQILSLYILAPDVVIPQFGTVLLTYAASLCYPLLIAGIILLVTLILRRGGSALVLGIVLYFVLEIIQNLITPIATATQLSESGTLSLQIMSLFSPNFALARYYQFYGQTGIHVWVPTASGVIACIGAGYVIVASIFVVAYFYVSRRLSL